MTGTRRIATWERVLWPTLAMLLFLSAWSALVHLSGTTVVPGPLKVWHGAKELQRKGVLWPDVLDSLWRVGAGFGLATLVGVPLGLALGWYPTMAEMVGPTLEVLRPISPLAWIPVAIVLFGVGDRPAVFLIFLGALFPIVTACASAVRTVPAVYRRAGSNFGLTPGQVLRRVVLPATLPQILVGLRIALGVAWLVVVAAEMIAVTSGLGYLVIDSRNAGKRYDLVVAAMLMIGAIGLVLDSGFRLLERTRAVRWGFRHERQPEGVAVGWAVAGGADRRARSFECELGCAAE